MPLIEIKNLGKTYYDEATTTALTSVSFNVDKGEFMAIMGPSGSGKSTLLHILGLLDKPTSGEYLFGGRNVGEYSGGEIAEFRNKKIGFIFQMFNLLRRTTVLENVKLPLLYSAVDRRYWDDMAKRAIESVGLGQRINHEPAQLSGGEQQRVAIARAIINNPEVIFADEPTGNLDSKSGGQVMSIIDSLHAEGRTIILITHETYTAEYAQRIIRLKDGEIESDEKVKSRRHADGHEFFK